MLGFMFFAVETVEQGSKVFDLPAEREHLHFFVAQSAFQILELTQDFSQFALHREWALGALFAASHGDIVKAFTGLREEERVRIFEGESASHAGFRDDVSVT